MMGSMSVHAIMQVTDLLFVGYLGTESLAAAGVSAFSGFVFMALYGGVTVAVQGTTARLVGEGEVDNLSRFLSTGLFIVLATAPFFSLILIALSPTILTFMTDDPSVSAIAIPYQRWLFGATTAFCRQYGLLGGLECDFTHRHRLSDCGH
jgi:Na+-driven multidrug efflux pump